MSRGLFQGAGGMGWVLMSAREVHRIEVLSGVVDGSLTVAQAAAVLCLSARQAQRLLKIFRQEGAASIRHTDLSAAVQTWINDLAWQINGRPKQTPGWRTPAEAMADKRAAL